MRQECHVPWPVHCHRLTKRFHRSQTSSPATSVDRMSHQDHVKGGEEEGKMVGGARKGERIWEGEGKRREGRSSACVFHGASPKKETCVLRWVTSAVGDDKRKTTYSEEEEPPRTLEWVELAVHDATGTGTPTRTTQTTTC